MKTQILAITLTVILLSVTGTFATVPNYINYQGTLTDSSGNPITGTRTIQFLLYADPVGGSSFWNELHWNVDITDGLFQVQLGENQQFPDTTFNGEVRWLEMVIDGETFTPRTSFVSVPYAYKSESSDQATMAESANHATYSDTATWALGGVGSTTPDTVTFAWWADSAKWADSANHAVYADTADVALEAATDDDWTVNADTIYHLNGNVGIGTTTPGYKLHIEGQAISGVNSIASGSYSAISGGYNNIASGNFSAVGGGTNCTASGLYASVGGGLRSLASYMGATVAGGMDNTANGIGSFVGGGNSNLADGEYSGVGAGIFNRARGDYSVVAGGGGGIAADSNSAIGNYSTIGGGRQNTTLGGYATVGGGDGNLADSNATVGGGNNNSASGYHSTVSGGWYNVASGHSAVVPGGAANTAEGSNSFAAGYRSQANHSGSFVWGDGSGNYFQSTAANQFNVRASGGVRIFSNWQLTAGVTLAAGASAWASVSDSSKKENFREVNTAELLEKVAALPIREWNYKAQDDRIRHIGPMAQDFWNLFHLGDDSLTISTIDPDGLALAAIQELHKENQQLEGELNELRSLVETIVAQQTKRR